MRKEILEENKVREKKERDDLQNNHISLVKFNSSSKFYIILIKIPYYFLVKITHFFLKYM